MAMVVARKWGRQMEPTPRELVAEAMANPTAANMLLIEALAGNVAEVNRWWRELMGDLGEGLRGEVAGALRDTVGTKWTLHLAAALGRGHACQNLLKEGRYDVDAVVCGGTPLIFAIEGSKPCEVIQMLLKHCADPNKACTVGETPLLIACQKGNYEVAKLLLSYGATIECIPGKAASPLHIATKNGDSKMLKLLLEHKKKIVGVDDIGIFLRSLLLLAFSKENTECFDMLLEALAAAYKSKKDAESFDMLLEALAAAYKLDENPMTSNVGSTSATAELMHPSSSTGEITDFKNIGDRPSSRTRSSGPITSSLQSRSNHTILGSFMPPFTASFPGTRQSATVNVIISDPKGTTSTNRDGTAEETAKITEKDSKKIKAKLNFSYGHMDKILSLVLGALAMAIAVAKASGFVEYHPYIFQILCASLPVMVCGSLSMFGYSAYYKEREDVSDSGFQIFSFLVLAQHILFLVLLCLIVLGVEGAEKKYVISASVFTAAGIILTWQIPTLESKSVFTWICDQCKKKRATDRHHAGLPTQVQSS